MFTRKQWRAMAWGYCFCMPFAALCIWVDVPVWFAPIVFLAGFVPTLLKMTE